MVSYICMKQDEVVNIAVNWVTDKIQTKTPDEWHCATRDIFQVRLQSFLTHVQKQIGDDAYLLTAIVGEIGNNSFDHNLGNWRDVPGVLFAYDMEKRLVVLADRGQGIRKTLSRVMAEIKDDQEALNIAFTRVVSGRKPERRGNGLKFVVQVLKEKKWSLIFRSGIAELEIKSGALLQIKDSTVQIRGCFAIIYY